MKENCLNILIKRKSSNQNKRSKSENNEKIQNHQQNHEK